MRFISGAASGLSSPDALALDGAGDVLVADGQGQIEDFAAGVSGKQVSPFASLAGSQTGIVSPLGVAISPPLPGISTPASPAATVVPSVLVTNGGSGTVTDYPLSPTGNVAPLFALGAGNKLSGPSGVAVDATGRVYVVNSASNSVRRVRSRRRVGLGS